MSASERADEEDLARLRADQRCEALIHSRVRNRRCGAKGAVQRGLSWFCRRHDPSEGGPSDERTDV
jgi:hypothetical protein